MSVKSGWQKIIIVFVAILFVVCCVVFGVWKEVFGAKLCVKGDKEKRVYIDRDDNFADFISFLTTDSIIENPNNFKIVAMMLGISDTTKLPIGCYMISSDMTYLQFLQRVKRGEQVPVKLTLNYMRLPEQFASNVSKQLMVDSTEVMNFITDELKMADLGYAPEHLFALVVRNTYEVWWTVSVEKLMQRLVKENDAFWNANERRVKAERLGLTIPEVITLASIVEEETNYQPEKSRVAGLYLNRLRKGVRLQSDPTVKFALKDFTLNRILFEHLKVDDPYNTYMYAGLPPGPIRLPSIATIDAVLNAEKHNYIYMCAHPDFNGTHNFAITLAEHNRNAAQYHIALKRWLAKKKKKN